MITAKIFEMGNGFPFAGDILMASDGGVYRLVETDGRIHTDRAPGNYIYGVLEETDSDADPFMARVEIDAR